MFDEPCKDVAWYERNLDIDYIRIASVFILLHLSKMLFFLCNSDALVSWAVTRASLGSAQSCVTFRVAFFLSPLIVWWRLLMLGMMISIFSLRAFRLRCRGVSKCWDFDIINGESAKSSVSARLLCTLSQ